MSSSKCIGLIPRRLLSEVGIDAAETINLTRDLPSTSQRVNTVYSFLGAVEKMDRPVVLWVVGTWGLGKTAVYYGLIEPYCRKTGKCISTLLVAGDIFTELEKILSSTEALSMRPTHFIAAILQVLRNKFKDLPDVSNYNKISLFLKDSLTILKNILKDKKLIIYIDEFEHIYDRYLIYGSASGRESSAKYDIGKEILEAIVEFINTNIDVLKETSMVNKIHLAFSVSEEADTIIKQKSDLGNIAGRLTRRFIELRLEPMNKIETLYHLDRLLKYVFDGENVTYKTIADPPNLLNVFGYSTGGLPGNTERMLNHMLSQLSMTPECPGGIRTLDINKAYDIFSTASIHFKGVPIELMNTNAFNELYTSIMDTLVYYEYPRDKSDILVKHILLTIAGMSLETLSRLTGFDRFHLKDAINTIEVALRDKYGGIEPIYVVKGYHIKKRVPEFINCLTVTLDEYKQVLAEELRRTGIPLISREAGERLTKEIYNLLFDSIIFIDDEGFLTLFYPQSEDRKASFVKNIAKLQRESTVISEIISDVIKRLVEKGCLEDSGKEYLFLVDEVVSKYFISPRILALEFIINYAERFRLLTKAITTGWSPQALSIALLPALIYSLSGFYSGVERTDNVDIREITDVGDFSLYSIEVRPSEAKKPALRILFSVLPRIVNEDIFRELINIIDKNYYDKKIIDVLITVSPRSIDELASRLNYVRTFRKIVESYDIDLLDLSGIAPFDQRRLIALGIKLSDMISKDTTLRKESLINELSKVLRAATSNIRLEEELINKYRDYGINLNKLRNFYITDYIIRYIPNLAEDIRQFLREKGKYIDFPILTGEGLLTMISDKEINISEDVKAKIKTMDTDINEPVKILPIITSMDECFSINGCTLSGLLDYLARNVKCYQPHIIKTKLLGPDVEGAEELFRNMIPLIGMGLIEIVECIDFDNSCRIRINLSSPYILTILKFVANTYKRLAGTDIPITYDSPYFKLPLGFIFNYYKYMPQYGVFVEKLIPEIFRLLGLFKLDKDEFTPLFIKNTMRQPNFLGLEEFYYNSTLSILQKLRDDEMIKKYGYIVSGKLRSYRASITIDLVNKLYGDLAGKDFEAVMKKVRMYSPMDLLDVDKLRLYTIAARKIVLVYDIITEILLGMEPYILPMKTHAFSPYSIAVKTKRPTLLTLISYVGKDFEQLSNIIKKIVDRYKESVKELEEILKRYVVVEDADIKIDIKEFRDVLDSYKNLNELMEKAIPSESFLKEVREIWIHTTGDDVDRNECRTGARIVRSSTVKASSFPFYFRSNGRKYLFNYKMYKAIEEIARPVFDKKYVRTDNVDPIEYIRLGRPLKRYTFNEKVVEERLDQLIEIGNKISTTIEKLAELDESIKVLKEEIKEKRKILTQYLGTENVNMIVEILSRPVAEASRIKPDKNTIETYKELENLYLEWYRKSFGNIDLESAVSIISERVIPLIRKFSFRMLIIEYTSLITDRLDKALKSMKYKSLASEFAIIQYKTEKLQKSILDFKESIRKTFEKFSVKEDLPPLKLIDKINNIMSHIDLELISSRSQEFFNELYTIINEVKDKIDDIRDQLDKYIERIDHRLKPCRNKAWTSKVEELVELCNKIKELQEEYSKTLDEFRDSFNGLKKTLENVKELLSKGFWENVKEIMEGSRQIVDECTVLFNYLETLYAYKEEIDRFLRYDIFDIIGRHADELGLSKPTIIVLKKILELRERSDKIEFAMLMNELKEELSPEELLTALKILRDHNLVSLHIIV